MTPQKLIDVVANLASFDRELTIYATKPWSPDSATVVAREPDEGGAPNEAKAIGAKYFIEIFIAKDVLDGSIAMEGRAMSIPEQCDRLIHYATYDA